jgi:hypothetical protein
MKLFAATVVLLAVAALGAAGAQVERVKVIAHEPGQDEAGVNLTTPIRVTFSAELDRSTLEGQIALAYSAEDSKERGEPEPPAIAYETDYMSEDRTLIIRPINGWLRFRDVRLTLGDGIRGTNGASLERFSLGFTTGGQQHGGAHAWEVSADSIDEPSRLDGRPVAGHAVEPWAPGVSTANAIRTVFTPGAHG